MNRTAITSTADGSVIITREARVGVSGPSKDRRKQHRNGVEETWRVTHRYITRLHLTKALFQSPQLMGNPNISIIEMGSVEVEMPELPGPPTVTPYESKPYTPPVVVMFNGDENE